MARELFIRINTDLTEISWQSFENGHQYESIQQGELAEAAALASGATVIVLVPSEEIFFTRTELPGKNRQRLLKALPYVVEDALIDDIDDLHFSMGVQAGTEYPVTAVEHGLMKKWCAAFTDAGIKPDIMIADAQALSIEENSWTLLLEAESALVRTANTCYSTDIENLEVLLSNEYEQSESKPESIKVYDCSGSNHIYRLQALTSGMEFEIVSDNKGFFSTIAAQYKSQQAVNLLHGEYAFKENIFKHLKPWLPAAAMFTIWISWQLVNNIFLYIDLSGQRDELGMQMEKLYKQAFPREKSPGVAYVRGSMESKIRKLQEQQGGASGSLQEMLTRTAPVFKETRDLSIESIRYFDGRLDVKLELKQASSLEQLKKKITEQTGWQVEEKKVQTKDNITEVRLEIKSQA